MSLRRTAVSLFVTFLALAAASPSAAQYSMAGKWGMEPSFGFPDLDLVQNAGTLSWNGGGTVGTINESTGEFHLNFGNLPLPGCGQYLIDGFVALDSLTFTGTVSYGNLVGATPVMIHCDYGSHPTLGSRCGNDELDPGEGCDDDNARDGDCCSSTCQYDASGAVCTSDNQQCTDAFCDGAGTCVPGGPSAAGTPCIDSDGCTTDDACDGAGACSGEPVECGPCGTCEYGLCRSPYECEESLNPTGAAALSMSLGDEPGDDRLTFKFKDGVPAEELGDPTTTTQYSLCVAAFDNSEFLAVLRPVLAFDLPVGGTCGTRDCWKASSSGFKYTDKASSSDGISLAAAATRGFKFKGKGALLPFGAELPTDELVVQVVSDDGVTRRCRQAFLTTSSSSTTAYRGGFKP